MREDNALILLCKLQVTLFASLFLNIVLWRGGEVFVGLVLFGFVVCLWYVICCLVVGFLLVWVLVVGWFVCLNEDPVEKTVENSLLKCFCF